MAGEKRLIFCSGSKKSGLVGWGNLVRWTELELNNCSEGLKIFRPLPGHLIKNKLHLVQCCQVGPFLMTGSVIRTFWPF